MEAKEGDQILIGGLRTIGCEFPEGVESFADFTNHLVVHAVYKFLDRVEPGIRLKNRLPNGAAARQRYCKALGKKIEELGYTGNTDYNQFLYPTEGEVRSLMRWVVEQIPKGHGEEAGEGMATGQGEVDGRMKASLATWRQQLWAPVFLDRLRPRQKQRYRHHRFATCPLEIPSVKARKEEYLDYANRFMPGVAAQAGVASQLAPSLLERNAVDVTLELDREADWSSADLDPMAHRARKVERLKGLKRRAFGGKGSGAGSAIPGTSAAAGLGSSGLQDILDGYRAGAGGGRGTAFSHQAEFATERATTTMEPGDVAATAAAVAAAGSSAPDSPVVKDEATIQAEREAELAALEERIAVAKARSATATQQAKHMTARMRQLTSELVAERGRTEELKNAYLVKKKTMEMLPEAAAHIASLQKICGASAAKLVSLAAEWEKHRKPRVEALRQHKEARSTRKDACKQKVVDIKRMRSEMQAMADEIRAKEQRVGQLKEQFSRMPRDLNRGMYTARIMDIVKQLRKLKVEISKVIANIREVQTDINGTTAKLKRTETLADEQMYQAAKGAKKDPAYVASYRHLSTLRDVFDKLISISEASGHATNAQRDLEARAEQLQASTSARNMETLLADLAQVRKENAEKEAQLRALAGR